MDSTTEPLIDQITNPDTWATWLDSFQEWLQSDVFVLDTLICLGIILVAATVARPLATRLQKQFQILIERESRFSVLDRLWQSARDISYPGIWLLLLWISVLVTESWGITNTSLVITTSLLAAWVIIESATILVSSHFWSRSIAISAWLLAALNILGILDPTIAFLDGVSFSLGQATISVLTIMQALVTLGILLWLSAIAGQITESKLKSARNLSPSIQVLTIKFMRISLSAIAFIMALAIVGVDLTAFAVVGGAVGVGIGFGLQKIFANLISGFILLMDKSIKPGDVIVVADYYGRVDALTARYVSVTTRDGVEHLIPNEELIINRVENWSHSHNLLRLRQIVGVHYKADVHKAIALCKEAAAETPRILDDPAPNCLMKEFGDSSVNLELRYWINDPMNGRANVTSDLLLRIWDKFHEHNIEIPYPQRDLHLRSSDISELPRER
ncbi:MAG: mechanosensitive ion channel [Gammaproteobacteria bacterium]|nr:mechanosensitive ion channel [Gammaproteobacteria bacterium]MDG2336722.1 mechanosensitive ion channel [Gammaproteobacteria bacterium]